MNKRYLLAIGLIIFTVLIVAGIVFSQRKFDGTTPHLPDASGIRISKSYTNKLMGFTITYPNTWINHTSPYAVPPGPTEDYPDTLASYIFLAPTEPVQLCEVIEPKTPARYVDIRLLEGSITQNREMQSSKAGGQNYKESQITIDGKTAYLFEPSTGAVQCPDGSSHEFRVFLIAQNGKVFSITTDLYNTEEVRTAISSLKFK